MALLAALVQVAPRLGCTMEAATVDHGLRPESAAEARIVVERVLALGVRCEILRVDVQAARGPHVSIQDAARRVRHAALEQFARARSCSRVALGHNADDQAETILFRVVRGTGLRGLAGIPIRRGVFIRPLLEVSRRDIQRFVDRRGIPTIDDPSNREPRFARSRVRHEWLPFLRRENPRIDAALLALAAEARALPPRASGHDNLPRRALAHVSRLARAGAGTRRVSAPGGEFEVSYGKVTFLPRSKGRALAASAAGVHADRIEIPGPGTYRLDPNGPSVELRETTVAPRGGQVVFDARALAIPLALRPRRPGERMRPRGGRGSKKVSELLLDAKVPAPQRHLLPVLTTARDEVLFVPGLRPSEIGRPGAATTHWLQVTVRQSAACPEGAAGGQSQDDR